MVIPSLMTGSREGAFNQQEKMNQLFMVVLE